MYTQAQALLSRRAAAFSIAVLVALVMALAFTTWPPTPASGSQPDEIEFRRIAMSVAMDPGPQISETSGISLGAAPIGGSLDTTVTLSLPGHYSVSSGTPAGFVVSTPAAGKDKGRTTVTWQVHLFEGVTTTLGASVVPSQTTERFETIRAIASPQEVAPYGPTEAALWARTSAGEPGAIVLGRPSQEQLEADLGSAIGLWNGSGGVDPYPAQPVGNDQLPSAKPADLGFRFLTAPEVGVLTTVELALRNTVSSTLGVSTTVIFPPDWQVLSGDVHFTAQLPPTAEDWHVYEVLPNSIDTVWQTEVEIDFTSQTEGPFESYHMFQYGGIDSNDDAWLGDQYRVGSMEYVLPGQGGALGGSTGVSVQSSEEKPEGLLSIDCERCWRAIDVGLPDPIYVEDYVNYLDGWIELADTYDGSGLRVELYDVARPFGSEFPRQFTLWAAAVSDDTGYYRIVMCGFPEHVLMRLVSTDLFRDHSIRTVDYNTEVLYHMENGPNRLITEDPCAYWRWDLFIDDLEAAKPFFIASFIAVDVREFLAPHGIDTFSGNYPVDALYPMPGTGGAGWDRIFIAQDCGDNMALIAHEYGHHTHYAAGGAQQERRFYEGWAIFQAGLQEEEGWFRGSHGGRSPACGGQMFLECITMRRGDLGDVFGGGAVFWDLVDSVSTEPADFENCDEPVNDDTSRTFEHVLAYLGDDVQRFTHAAGYPGSGPGLYEEWSDPDDNFRALSYNHQFAFDEDARHACLPGSP